LAIQAKSLKHLFIANVDKLAIDSGGDTLSRDEGVVLQF